jgi:hypothetical protein
MNTHSSTEYALHQGQQLQTPVRRGTHILVTKGMVQLEGSATWVGDSTFGATAQLHEGQIHVVDHAGWIGVTAESDASIVAYAPQSALWGALNAAWEQAGRWLGRTDVVHLTAH